MTTTPSSPQPYLDAYRLAEHQHGSDFGVTLWASPHTQTRRFQIITQMSFLAGKRILDVGCSRGDLAAYLLERDIDYAHYVGVDALEPVLDFARRRKLPRAAFHYADLLTDAELLDSFKAQIVVISGTLNTMSPHDALRALDNAWHAASQSLIFNFLSDQATLDAPPQDDPARRLPTLKLLQWAMNLTPSVQFRQDYFKHGHDATILMHKR